MNHWNKLLPSVVKDGIDKDEADSLHQIEGTIHEITVVLHEKKCLLTNKQVGKLVRQINTHSTLKYTFKVSLKTAENGYFLVLLLFMKLLHVYNPGYSTGQCHESSYGYVSIRTFICTNED